jgi:hypothetical protein
MNDTSDAQARQQQSPDSIRVVNGTDAPIYVLHMPERSARPLRQEIPLDLTAPPAGYLAPDSSTVIPFITCDQRVRLEGDDLLLYRIGPPDAEQQAMATLAATRPFTAEVLAALPETDCRLVIDSLDSE